MKYTKLLFPMMLLVAGGAVFAATVDDTGMSFDELDQDSNGAISRAEAEGAPGLGERFDVLDANADGMLDENEVGVGGPSSGTGEGDVGEGEAPAADESIKSD